MYKFVGPSEVISSKQKKTEIKLDINLLSKTNKYKTKQTNQKYQTERKKNNIPHVSFTVLFITWMMYSALDKL
jgi:hypothetical protein